MDQMTKAAEALLMDVNSKFGKFGGEPTEDHDQNAARLIDMVRAEAAPYADIYGQEVADRCVAAFTKACENQRYVSVCSRYAKAGAFSPGAVLNTLMRFFDY